MRKFIFSSAMLGVVAGGWNILQATRRGPRDWRLVLMWIGWALSAAVAIGTIVKDADERQIDS
ncbi:hypothetical protein E3O44_03585 [Cryobacterium algoricola]|uniref:Uncharacterized protein n=2 Tax=Cryobacterium TaxID=69578 RepID=A0AA41QU25_9MICO|nr:MULTISPECIES: hypothetical protein [Cryobacterium]MCI4657183.1 hypothetical protein [Cryobacterium zhongshanensis]TFB90680.1 hypothetical protein E3O44_03585 [Cryobacterium algoricola]